MSGRATFTIVMSSRSMNVPRQTATSVHHLALPLAAGAAEGPASSTAACSGGRWMRGSVMVISRVAGGCVQLNTSLRPTLAQMCAVVHLADGNPAPGCRQDQDR